MDEDPINTKPKKSWDEIQKDTIDLMQIVHLNNVDAHKVMRKNKEPIDIDDIKQVNLDQSIGVRSIGHPTDEEGGNDSAQVRVARRRVSITHFYADNGPREEWDSLLMRHAKQLSKSRALGRGRGGASKTVANMTKITPIQSVLNQSESNFMVCNIASTVSGRPMTLNLTNLGDCNELSLGGKQGNIFLSAPRPSVSGSIQSSPPMRSPQKTERFRPPPLKPTQPNFMEQMKQMKKNEEANDDDAGPYDFRSLLKKSDFAPTASLRKRKVNIPVIKRSEDFPTPINTVDVMEMQGEAIDL